MKRPTKLTLLILTIGAMLLGAGYFARSWLNIFATEEFETVDSIEFENTCVGRHMVNLPANWGDANFTLSLNGLRVSVLQRGDVKTAESLFQQRRKALDSGIVKDGVTPVVLRWSKKSANAFILAHSYRQRPGWPKPMEIIEGWASRDGVIFYMEGNPWTPYDSPAYMLDVLARLRPHAGGPPPKEGSCFPGGYFEGPLRGTEGAVVEMNSLLGKDDPNRNIPNYLNLTLDLYLYEDRPGKFTPDRFGDLTRQYPIAGVPGGERVAIFKNADQRDSGIELLATAGGTVDGVGLDIRAEITKQRQFPETPPFGPNETLTIWHSMLKSITRIR